VSTLGRAHHAGGSIDDLCRACKATRKHTVIALDAQGSVARVLCDSCGSQHNYRGGADAPAAMDAPTPPAAFRRERESEPAAPSERTEQRMSPSETESDLELVLRRVLRQELGLTPVVPADKWRGGELVLRPGKPGLQEKKWPIDSFFHKVVMIRNRLRTLEQQVNASELPDDAKVRLQAYVSACYGSLTSFNVLFAREEDQFRGASSDE
jgi:hypothetical protein